MGPHPRRDDRAARAGSQLTADRYTHVGSVPFPVHFGAALGAALLLLARVLIGRSARQTTHWRDGLALWTHVEGAERLAAVTRRRARRRYLKISGM